MRSSEEQSLLFLETGLILAISWPVFHPGNLPLPLPVLQEQWHSSSPCHAEHHLALPVCCPWDQAIRSTQDTGIS